MDARKQRPEQASHLKTALAAIALFLLLSAGAFFSYHHHTANGTKGAAAAKEVSEKREQPDNSFKSFDSIHQTPDEVVVVVPKGEAAPVPRETVGTSKVSAVEENEVSIVDAVKSRRRSALRVTVAVLIVLLVVTAAVVGYYVKKRDEEDGLDMEASMLRDLEEEEQRLREEQQLREMQERMQREEEERVRQASWTRMKRTVGFAAVVSMIVVAIMKYKP